MLFHTVVRELRIPQLQHQGGAARCGRLRTSHVPVAESFECLIELGRFGGKISGQIYKFQVKFVGSSG